jgi:photosystem II stability/assembly factor-like uncharacterized protein
MKISIHSKKTRAGHRICAVQAAALLMALSVSSCDDGQTPEPAPLYAMTLSADTLHSRARGDTAGFVVRSTAGNLPAPFAVSGKPDWVTVQAINDSTLQVIFAPNPLKQARSGSIVLAQQAGGGTTAALALMQNALKTKPVWKQASIPTDQIIVCITFVDDDPNTVFCAVGNSAYDCLYKSADGGKNWKLINDKMDAARSLTGDLYRIIEKWMHWSSPTQGTLIITYPDHPNVPWYILKTFDGGLTWEQKVIRSKLRSLTVPAAGDRPAFVSTENFDYPMQSMLISPDRDWNTALLVVWSNRFTNSNTGYAAKDYTYVGCSNGELWRVPTADLFQKDTTWLDPNSLDMTRFEVKLPDGAAIAFMRALQEAGGALYCLAVGARNLQGHNSWACVMKSIDKGETWTLHAEIPDSDRRVELKVFDDGNALVVGREYLYTIPPGGDIASAIPLPQKAPFYIWREYTVNFAAYDMERVLFSGYDDDVVTSAAKGIHYYLAEEAIEEEE